MKSCCFEVGRRTPTLELSRSLNKLARLLIVYGYEMVRRNLVNAVRLGLRVLRTREGIEKNENVAEDADRGFDQRPYLVCQDRLEAGLRPVLSGLWVRPSTQTTGLIREISCQG